MAGHGSLAVLTLLFSLATASCSSHKAENKPVAAQEASQPKAAAKSVPSEIRQPEAEKKSTETRPAGTATQVRLTSEGCIEFEPHWTTIMPGHAVTWHSDLKSPVVIHVSQGAFEKSEYVVRPGATVSTGPARGTGTYTIWTEPKACQGVQRGVQGSGPGITVQAAAAH